MPDHPANMKKIEFPRGFLWGASTSAFQNEGNNTRSDWWQWEQTALPPHFRSGQACDHYQRFEEDFDLVYKLGHNAHRLSLEWSRIEPEEGRFDETEILHYKKVLEALKSRNIKVFLTLHHFSNPLWFAKKGGWENPKSPFYFERYVKRVVPEYKDLVDFWITINEPNAYGYFVYIERVFPGAKKSRLGLLRTQWHLAKAHQRAYRIIHKIKPDAQVGIANATGSYDVFHHHNVKELFYEWTADISQNHLFYLLTGKGTHDFLGVNYYNHFYIDHKGQADNLRRVDTGNYKEVSDLGWEIYPEGLFGALTDLSDYNKPIYITENGIAAKDDRQRSKFILNHLLSVYHAIGSGANVRGYLHWTLMDNMELHRGYEPKFGLIEVDFKTQKRTPKPSAYLYREIIKANGISHRLLK